MADNIKQTILKAEKLAIKLKKKLKRNDLDFSIQVSLSSADPGKIYYALQLTPVADGVAPMTFIKSDPDKLIEAIESQLEKIDTAAVEVAYHEGQINHAKRTITFHQERIDEIKQDGDGIQEAEIVSEPAEEHNLDIKKNEGDK